MALGIRKLIVKASVNLNAARFKLRKFLFGFENANMMIRSLDKESLKRILKSNGADIGTGCDIESGLTFHNCSDYGNFKVGENAHVGKNCFIDLAGKVIIEKNAVISMNTSFLTHLNIHRSKLESLYPSSVSDIRIGNDSYIGAGCIILMGVDIGEGSFIAAGSTVLKSFPPGSFIAGSPAVIKKQL